MDEIVSTRNVALVEENLRPLDVQLVNSKKTNKMSSSQDLVELARAVQKADDFTKANAGSKLTIIVDQIRYLQSQARKALILILNPSTTVDVTMMSSIQYGTDDVNVMSTVLEDAKRDTALHHAACNFVKKPGTMYYLYERPSGQSYLSMLSPQEWGSSCPHEFLGAFRLEYDQSWTPISEVPRRDEENSLVDMIYNAQQAITTGPLTADILGIKKSISASIITEATSDHIQSANSLEEES